MVQCKGCTNQAGLEFAGGAGDKCWLLNAAYILAGLAMMLNIRLSYSSAPYALIRFKLPENLFSVFVRRMASALELWCLPSMLLGNIMDLILKIYYYVETTKGSGTRLKLDESGTKFDEGTKPKAKPWKFEWFIVAPSILSQWLDFITYVVLLIIYVTGGDQGHETAYYGVIAISGFIFGINMPLICAQEGQYITWYMIGENSFPMVTSLMHYVSTFIFGNRRRCNSDYIIVMIDIIISLGISFVAAVLWTGAYLCELNEDTATGIEKMLHIHAEDFDERNTNGDMVTPTFMVIVGMGLLIATYPIIVPGMIVPFYLVDKIEMVLLIATIFPPMIVAVLRRFKRKLDTWSVLSPTCKWAEDSGKDGSFWNAIDLILMITKITLAVVFIYSLQYRDSNLAR